MRHFAPGWVLLAGLLAATASAAPSTTAATPSTDADAHLRRLQESYRATPTITLEFTESFENKATGRTLTERGRLWSQRPDRMRWEYVGEETKLFVMADGIAWFYVPEDETVWRMRTTDDRARSMPVLFLTGDDDLVEHFAAEVIEQSDQAIRLQLTPRSRSAEYDHLELELSASGEQLRALRVHDVLGNVTEFTFEDEQRGVTPPGGAFEFTIPPGVDVVDAEP